MLPRNDGNEPPKSLEEIPLLSIPKAGYLERVEISLPREKLGDLIRDRRCLTAETPNL